MLLLGERAEMEKRAGVARHLVAQESGVAGLGPDEDKIVPILNRIVELFAICEGSGRGVLTYEPDARHVEIAAEAVGLIADSAKVDSAPVVRSSEYSDDTPLKGQHITKFRSVCMRLSFRAVHWPHLLYSTREMARKKSTVGALARLKRAVRYLKGAPRWVQVLEEQHEVVELVMATDPDFAGCLETRKSTIYYLLSRGMSSVPPWVPTAAPRKAWPNEGVLDGFVTFSPSAE